MSLLRQQAIIQIARFMGPTWGSMNLAIRVPTSLFIKFSAAGWHCWEQWIGKRHKYNLRHLIFKFTTKISLNMLANDQRLLAICMYAYDVFRTSNYFAGPASPQSCRSCWPTVFPSKSQNWALFQYQGHLTNYVDSHYKEKMVIRPSYLDKGIKNTGKTASFLRKWPHG